MRMARLLLCDTCLALRKAEMSSKQGDSVLTMSKWTITDAPGKWINGAKEMFNELFDYEV